MSFTLTFNTTLPSSPILVSGFSFSSADNIVYTCDDPNASATLTGFNTSPYQSTLVSVENIPATVTTIEDYAFDNCSALTSITIPASVTNFGEYAFQICNALTSVTLTDGLTIIGYGAFVDCSALTSITIPASVTNFGGDAFNSCSALTNVTLTDGLTIIGLNAFRSTGITSITIPSSVTSISGGAFRNCFSLTSVALNNGLQTIEYNTFRNCTALTSITIPATVTNLGESTFNNCIALTSVTLTDGLQTIDFSTFRNCTALTSITIPSSITTIKSGAFQDCTALTSITIPSSVTSIGTNAFTGIPTYPPQPTLQNAATLYTTPLNVSTNPVYAYFKSNFIDGVNQINYFDNAPLPTPMVCFKEDSKILTKKGYTPIQDLRKGDLIKTLKNGYKAIDMIGFREIYNPICEERIKDKLYVCSTKVFTELFEDLIITGCHAILEDNFISQEQLDESKEILGGIFFTEEKRRIPACVDKRTIPYEKEGKFMIYHLALENEDYFMNYGIYANGLIVETCSKRYLKELSNMTLIE